MGEYGTLPILPDQKIRINLMVKEEIKNDRRGWEREGSRHGQPGRRRGPWQGSEKESRPSVSVPSSSPLS